VKTAIVYIATWLAFVPATFFSSAYAEVYQVIISTTSFAPKELTAHVGDTIEWMNKDFIDHTATAIDKSFDIVLPTGKKKSFVLSKQGAIDYFCRYHPNMKGKITVVAK
jgi:plastocyanin